MQTHDSTVHDEPLSSPDRAAHLDAAGRALRAWLATRHDPAAPAPLPTVAAAPVVRVPVNEPEPPVLLEPEPAAQPVAPVSSRVLFSVFDAPSIETRSAVVPPDLPHPPGLDNAAPEPEDSPPASVWPVIAFPRRPALVAAGLALAIGAGWVVVSYRSTVARMWASAAAVGSAALAPTTTGIVVIESVPEALVVLDGAEVGMTPLSMELSPGRHVLEFRRGSGRRRVEVEVVAGQSAQARVDWTARRTGRLQVDSVPPGATVIIAGRERGVTPLALDDLDVGTHTLVLRSPAGTVQRTVTITADRPAAISEAIYSGFLHVSAPIELVIARDGQRLRLDDRDQVLLPPGVHQLTFENVALGFADVREVEIRPGETAQVSIEPPATELTVTATQPSEVYVDGERVGETSIIRLPLSLGTHTIVVRSTTSGAQRQVTVTATTAPVAVDIDYQNP